MLKLANVDDSGVDWGVPVVVSASSEVLLIRSVLEDIDSLAVTVVSGAKELELETPALEDAMLVCVGSNASEVLVPVMFEMTWLDDGVGVVVLTEKVLEGCSTVLDDSTP